QFKEFYSSYYHPSNSKTVLYGNFDIEEKLKHMAEFLDSYDYLELDSKIIPQAHRTSPYTIESVYPVSPDATDTSDYYIMRSWLLEDSTNLEINMAFTALSRILSGTTASPLRKALIDSGLGEDTIEWYESDILNTNYTIGMKGVAEENIEKVEALIDSTLTELSVNGFDERTIESTINTIEFRLREANYGSYSKGLVYAMQMMPSWNYEQDPLAHLKYEEPLRVLKEKIAGGNYFESLVKKYLLDNGHRLTYIMRPDKTYEKRRIERLETRLADKFETLSDDDKSAIIDQCQKLQKLQETPDTPEALATIPKLPVSSIDTKSEELPFEIIEQGLSFSEHNTNGIAYMKFTFDASHLSKETLTRLSLFGTITRQTGTSKRDFVNLSEEIGIHTGGLGNSFSISTPRLKADKIIPQLEYTVKILNSKIPKALEILAEIFSDFNVENTDRIADLMRMSKSNMQSSISNSGERFATIRMGANNSAAGVLSEYTKGISYFNTLTELNKEFEKDSEPFISNCKKIKENILNSRKLHVHFTGDKDGLKILQTNLSTIKNSLSDYDRTLIDMDLELFDSNDALIIPSKVNYVGKSLNFYKHGYDYDGSFAVLNKLLSREYLWQEVRVKGNAYGCYCNFSANSGNFYVLSYRDPHLKKTLETFDKIPDYLNKLDLSDDEFEKMIIGTIGSIDGPMSPDQKGSAALSYHFTGIKQEHIQAKRDQILACKKSQLKDYADIFNELKNHGNICVVGGESINDDKDLFDTVTNVFAK
ncbi:MAG: insulinase family protein, partial [Lentisphaeria bacterium]|nr:insulinase family protein [Lentisphaeria bacterium]NQZ70043.1 insulinase family protein [Lentisphaeria bacterium]